MQTATEHIRYLFIGLGSAGYTAAIYAARSGLRPAMNVYWNESRRKTQPNN